MRGSKFSANLPTSGERTTNNTLRTDRPAFQPSKRTLYHPCESTRLPLLLAPLVARRSRSSIQRSASFERSRVNSKSAVTPTSMSLRMPGALEHATATHQTEQRLIPMYFSTGGTLAFLKFAHLPAAVVISHRVLRGRGNQNVKRPERTAQGTSLRWSVDHRASM